MSVKYFYKFRNTDLGLTPSFVFYKNASTLADVTPPPSHVELAGGVYYFEPDPNSPEIVFQIDGGAGLPEEVRYISSSVVPKEAEALSRMVGLLHENSVMDNTAYSGGKLTSARVRLYDSPANATAAGATGKLFEYQITATYTGGNLSTYLVTRTS